MFSPSLLSLSDHYILTVLSNECAFSFYFEKWAAVFHSLHEFLEYMCGCSTKIYIDICVRMGV